MPDPFAAYRDTTAPPPPAASSSTAVPAGDPFSAYRDVKAAPPPGPSPHDVPISSGTPGDPEAQFGIISNQMSSENKRMIGGALGSLAVGAATEGLGLVPDAVAYGPTAGSLAAAGARWVASKALPIAGAYGGGAAVAAAQGAPPGEVNAAGTTQAEYEGAGQIIGAPVNWFLKRVAASNIYKSATAGLAAAKKAIGDQVGAQLDRADQLVADTRAGASDAVQAGQARTAAAQTTSRQGVEAATNTLQATRQAGDINLASERTRFANTPPPSTTTAQAGQQVAGVLRGGPGGRVKVPRGTPSSPVQQSFRDLGQRVGDALDAMPAQDVTGIKAQAQDILDRETVLPSADEAGAAISVGGQRVDPSSPFYAQAQAAMAKSGVPPPNVGTTPIASPSRTALLKIAGMPDQVSAVELHQANTEVWRTVGNRQDQGLSDQGVGRAKTMYGAIRDQLGAASPEFDAASNAYDQAATRYKNSLAPEMVKKALKNPDAVAGLVRVDEPERLRMLHEVFLEHGGPEGQTAWNTLRSHVVYDHFIDGGLDKLSARLADPQSQPFIAELSHDADGQTVFANLRQIASGFDRLQQQTEANLAAARAGVRTARSTGAQGVDAAQAAQRTTKQTTGDTLQARTAVLADTKAGGKEALDQISDQQEKLIRSSLKGVPGGFQTAKDLAVLGGASALAGVGFHEGGSLGGAFGGASAMWILRRGSIQRLLQTPVMADLTQWASFSPKWTQALVQAVQGPGTGMALANLIRTMNMEHPREAPMASHSQTPAATPPPASLSTVPPPPR